VADALVDDAEDDGKMPRLLYTFGVPIDDDLERAYYINKPSKDVEKLYSESQRTIFAEDFIENRKLGTLRDLCIRSFAKNYASHPGDIYEDVLDERVHYDALDLDIPIENCYDIDSKVFWRKFVLARSKDIDLHLQKYGDIDWKGIGLSMKFVEILENCPAEFFFIDKVTELALLIKDFVKSINIKKLQPLKESSFENYFLSESDTNYETPSQLTLTITTITDSTAKSKSSEVIQSPGSSELTYDGEQEDESIDDQTKTSTTMQNKTDDISTDYYATSFEEEFSAEESAHLKYVGEDPDYKRMRSEKRKAKAAQIKRRAERDDKRERRKEKLRLRQNGKEPDQTEGETKVYHNIFEIEASLSEPDLIAATIDRRNAEELLNRQRRFLYDSSVCLHINLSVLGQLTELTELSVSFDPGEFDVPFHPRLYRFSYMDMQNLAS